MRAALKRRRRIRARHSNATRSQQEPHVLRAPRRGTSVGIGMTQSILLFLALVVTRAMPGESPLLSDTAIAQLAYELLRDVGAADAVEHAAFVVRTPAGTLALQRWPGGGFHAARWTGAPPKGVIAVMHTHPRERPAPSTQDRAEAKRLHVPFYVVSRAGLCVADAAGGVHCAARIPWLTRGSSLAGIALQWTPRAGTTS